MFKDVNELKEFISWCKDNKILAANIGDTSFQLHDSAFHPEVDEADLETIDENIAADLYERNAQSKEDEALLFHSSQP